MKAFFGERMKLMCVYIPRDLRERLDRVVARRPADWRGRATISAAVRDALEAWLREEEGKQGG